jgi:ArsR family transcriptional regulator, arsenate/arsenite/antimonite-responsive transcriptional repressor
MGKILPLVQCCTPLTEATTLSDAAAVDLERLLKAIADKTRLKIVHQLMHAREDAVCVCDIVPELGLTQPTISYHLKQLREAGLVEREKRGTFAHYRLAPGALDRVGALFADSGRLAQAV